MKVFVTGATGFVGSHLCDQLKTQGHEVYILVRSPKKLEEFQVPGIVIKGSLSYQEANTWIDQLPDDLDAVVHTAGLVHAYDPQTFYDINTKATERLIDDLKDKYSELNFILISSMAAAGPTIPEKALTESDNENPVSEYGKSKLEAELALSRLAPKSWAKNILRPPIVIGPRDPAILDIFKMVKQGFVLMAGFDGLSKQYSYVCVHDLVDVIMANLKTNSPETRQVYFTSAPNAMTFGELVEIIQRQMKKERVIKLLLPQFIIAIVANIINFLAKFLPLNVRLTKDKLKEITPSAWLVSGEKSRKDLDITYQWNLEKTVAITLEDYRKRNWL